ncbi:hypothetical protein GFC01_09440 [Desulfofundulus thermobenzoicus]|uniref:Transmembrane protein (Alph_Pro_TM) n=1 Tax=Desulfofundulus thermobenzoicus TaxID=29376 RepID=A0A6N7IRE4_9FIRM|nr:TIGR02186 family protein [Desulfofundulus thermobenzoicus]MQL52481.1 hypothetical protein [Desulfofundulus thermobenzoicus]HHW44595.1 hypothetical protein [Desulfotomaculum sp.]
MKNKLLVFLLVAMLLLPGAPLALAQSLTVNTNPSTVEVGLNFAGETVKISGQVPEGSRVFIKVLSPERTVGLSKKGKKGGIFYMTVETVNVKGMPGMYKVLGSDRITSLTPELQRAMGIDSEYSYIRGNAQVVRKHDEKSVVLPPAEAKEYLDGLVRLNTQRGLYSMSENAVMVRGNQYEATLAIPPEVPRGDSQITVYAVKDGRVVATASRVLPVVNVGLVRSLGGMAQVNAVAYGVLCIAVALTAGIVIAGLFKLINKYLFKDEGVSAHH